jgi:hypothetical protein
MGRSKILVDISEHESGEIRKNQIIVLDYPILSKYLYINVKIITRVNMQVFNKIWILKKNK